MPNNFHANGVPTLPDELFDSGGDDSVLTGYKSCNVTTWGKPVPSHPCKRNRKIDPVLSHPLPAILRSRFSLAVFCIVIVGLAFAVGVQVGRSAKPAAVVLGEVTNQ